jgi:hypothetical protein
MIVKTRNGVFSNQGYGGGTFNNNTAFGAVDTRNSMRQHRYGDVSNLNAPYDNLSLQGLRGVGSLSGTTLGALTLDDLPTEDAGSANADLSDSYPWMVESPATLTLQKEINKGLVSRGYNVLKEDGILGARTCGALAMDKATGMVGTACDAHVSEFIAPTKATGVTSPQNQPITSPQPMVETGKGMPAWVWGVLLGSAAVAAVVYAKKRKGRSVTLSTSYG